jgi:hypothetical protein
MMQDAPGASMEPQLLVSEKSAGLAPASEMARLTNVALPIFESVIV